MQIQKHNVGHGPPHLRVGVRSVASLTDDLHVRLALQPNNETLSDEIVFLHDDNSYGPLRTLFRRHQFLLKTPRPPPHIPRSRRAPKMTRAKPHPDRPSNSFSATA